MTVLPPNADASSSETGTLTGSVTSGTITLDANGIATAASSVQLNVQSGTGQYGSITADSGTLSLSADPENSTKLGGPLVLNFNESLASHETSQRHKFEHFIAFAPATAHSQQGAR